MIYLWLWRRASSILLCDLPRLALAGRLYQQTRQLYALYMLRDKIGRRGFSDKTVKDYLSFGGPVVICYQSGFRGEKKGMTGMERWWKRMEKRKRSRGEGGKGVGGIEDGRRRRGELSCWEDFVFCLISCPLPLPSLTPPLSNELSVSHILNLPSKHSGMIGAVSQTNVLFATGGTGRKRWR